MTYKITGMEPQLSQESNLTGLEPELGGDRRIEVWEFPKIMLETSAKLWGLPATLENLRASYIQLGESENG